MKTMKSQIYIIMLILCVILMIGCNRTDYKKAMLLTKNGNYEEAIVVFEQLGDYKDSIQMQKECRYQIASQSLSSEDYQNAIMQFEEIVEFKDSTERIQEAKYLYGKVLLSQKEYDMAYSLFEEIKEYKDANTLLQDIVWNELYDFIQNNATEIGSTGTRSIKSVIGGVAGYHSDFIISMDSPDELFFYFETTNPSMDNLVRRELVTIYKGNPVIKFTEYAYISDYSSSLTEIGTVDIRAEYCHKTMNVKLDKYFYNFQYGQYSKTSYSIEDADLINEDHLGVLFTTALRSCKLFLEENGLKMTLSDLGFGNIED